MASSPTGPTFSEHILRHAVACPATLPSSASDDEIARTLGSATPALLDSLAPLSLSLAELVEADGLASVILDRNPWAWVPTFRTRNATVVRPAQHACSLQAAVEEVRSQKRNYQAYVRHQSLEALPAFAAALNASRVPGLIGGGSRVQRANLWLGDGGLASSLHWDSFDNLLLQLQGEKLVLLLPPRAGRSLGYAPHSEHRYVFDGTRFTGTERTGAEPADNLSPVWLGANERSLPPQSDELFTSSMGSAEGRLLNDAPPSTSISPEVLDGSVVCRLSQGQSLFIPALWSHAVISSTASLGGASSSVSPTEEQEEHASKCSPAAGPQDLNAAINVWYARDDVSVQSAMASGADAWPAARAALLTTLRVLGRDAATAGRYEEAAATFGRLTALEPSDAEAQYSHGLALQDAGHAEAARAALTAAVRLVPAWAAPKAALSALQERQRLHRAIASSKGGWSRDLERKLRRQSDKAPPVATAMHGTSSDADAAILSYGHGHPDATALCVEYFNGDRRAAKHLEQYADDLVRCHAEYRLATQQTRVSVEQQLEAAAAAGRLLIPKRWDATRCRSDPTPGVRSACDFAASAWGVGRTRRGGWDADLEAAAVLASPDAVARAQVINDARELRFVRFDNPLLERGLASATHAPGMSATPWHVYAAQQGLAQSVEYLGLPQRKMAWDLALYSMAVEELQPQAIIELGTGSGAHAMWLADEAIKRGMQTAVHTIDVKSAAQIAAGNTMSETTWRELLSRRGVTFHGGSDLEKATAALPDALLRSLPHPWLVIEDAHANTAKVVRRIFDFMKPGDVLVCEDIRFADRKRKEWFAFLEGCGDRCALDLKYLDFFGVNQCCAPDGWLKKVK